MIQVLIPARGGSKGVLRKNLQKLDGWPLVKIAIEQARAIFHGFDHEILVSTEDPEIMELCEPYSVARPVELATDMASTQDVICHHMEGSGADFGALLQPTHPFRSVKALRAAVDVFMGDSAHDSLIHCRTSDSFFWTKDGQPVNGSEKRMRRQDREPLLEETGAFYMYRKTVLDNPDWIHGRILPWVTAYQGIDIDTKQDLRMAQKTWDQEWLT